MTPKNKQNNRLPLRWKKYADGDIFIPVLTFLLAAFGVLAVYSASSYVAQKQYGEATEEYKAVKNAKEDDRKQIETQLTAAAEEVTKSGATKVLEWYKTKRKEKLFPIVGVLNQGRCPFCSMEPPIAVKSKLADGIECDNCHRIIFSE